MTNNVKKVVSLWSPVAGTGTTFTAINIAKVLGEKGKKVALLDFDLKLPSTGIYLQMQDIVHCLDNIIPFTAGENLTETIIDNNISRIGDIYVLQGTKLPEQAQYITIKSLEVLVESIKKYFDHIVIDTHNVIDNAGTYVAFQQADVVLVVVDKSAITVQHYDQVRNIISSSFDLNRFKLIINKCHKNIYMEKQAVEQYMNFVDSKEIPLLDVGIINALNQGKWIEYMKTRQAKQYIESIKKIVSSEISFGAFKELKKPEIANKKTSLFGFLGGKNKDD